MQAAMVSTSWAVVACFYSLVLAVILCQIVIAEQQRRN